MGQSDAGSAGCSVTGTTRSLNKAPMLHDLGVEPVVVDVFDAALLLDIVCKTKPEIVVHQLTDLPPAPRSFANY